MSDINTAEVLARFNYKMITTSVQHENRRFVAKDSNHIINQSKEAYHTYFNHSEEIIKYFEQNNSLAGYKGIVAADYLLIDIDCDKMLEKALDLTRLIVRSIESRYNTKDCNVYFSGNKGFHIVLPSYLFGEFAPDYALPAIHKEIAKEIIKPFTKDIEEIEKELADLHKQKSKTVFDLSIYKVGQLIRVANSINNKSGLFKIPLTHDELYKLDMEEIKRLAAQPRGIDLSLSLTKKENSSLTDLYWKKRGKCVTTNSDTHNHNSTIDSPGSDDNITIEITGLNRVEKHCTWFSELMKKVDFNHEERVQLTKLLLNFGEEGKKKLHELFSRCSDYDREITEHQINSIDIAGKYSVACNILCENNICRNIKVLNRSSCLAFAFVNPLDKFSESFIVERFVKRHNHLIYSIQGQEFYEYEDGIYKVVGEVSLKALLESFMKLFLPSNEVTATRINKVYERLKYTDAIQYQGEFNSDYGLINLKNGVYNLKEKKLLPHSPSHYHTIQLGFNYDPNARADRFQLFLYQINSSDREKIEFILNTMCYFLIPNYSYQKIFVFYGSGRNGKGTLVNVITQLLGKQNITGISVHDLAKDRFSVINLHNKLLNVSGEISVDDLALDMVKKLSGNDDITARNLYKTPITFQNKARLVINANQLPRFSELNTAVLQRFVLINFPNSYLNENDNPNLKKELETELPGIFNMVVKQYDSIVKGEEGIYYPIPETIKREQEILLSETSTAMEFFIEECEYKQGRYLPLQDLYDVYKDYCSDNGYKALGKKKFSAALKCLPKLSFDDQNYGVRVYGIAYKEGHKKNVVKIVLPGR